MAMVLILVSSGCWKMTPRPRTATAAPSLPPPHVAGNCIGLDPSPLPACGERDQRGRTKCAFPVRGPGRIKGGSAQEGLIAPFRQSGFGSPQKSAVLLSFLFPNGPHLYGL